MKHYAYTIFNNTLMSFVHRYVAKYGSDSVLREKAFTRVAGTGKNLLDMDLWDAHNPAGKVYGGATMVRPNAKANEERHEDVVINGRWQGGSGKRLEKVKPWDTLIPIGHGIVYQGTNQIVTNKCSNDGGTENRTVNDLVNWFGADQDNLSKDHVVIKLAMCYGGGGGDEAPADCFAKQLAIALFDAGWKTIMVGGTGTFESGGVGRAGSFATEGNKKIFTEMVFTPNKSSVQHLGSSVSKPAKDNLIYFNGSGAILQASEVQNVKLILRGYPATASLDDQKAHVKNLRVQFTTQAPAHLALLPGKVLEMLEKRLGITVPLVQTIQPPVQAQVQSATQGKPDSPTRPPPKTPTQATTQPKTQTTTQPQAPTTGQKGKLCRDCGLWPLSTPGWKCPNGCTSALTRFG